MIKYFAIVLGLIASISLIFQYKQWYDFKNKGKRFTADNGQELCLRVQRLEEHYNALNYNHLPKMGCNYNK